MSLAPSRPTPSSEPGFDLTYSVEDFAVSPHHDHSFLVARMEAALLAEASPGARTLDVGCGVGALSAKLQERGALACGLDPSGEMLGLGVFIDNERRRLAVRGLAESLPFRDASFDLILCEGALDHFVNPTAFMLDACRALDSRGRLVIALANYDSLSCRIGRTMDRLRHAVPAARPYWKPPGDHNHRGDLTFVRRLGAGALRLERCYGISLLWLLPGWGKLLDRLPSPLADKLVRVLDWFARPAPQLADVVVSVWSKESP